MAAAWRDGLQTPAEKWLERHPQFSANPQLAVQIVYEEICLREEQGEHVKRAEIYARFPQWQSALEVLLDCHGLMQTQQAATTFPESGQRLGEFQLLCELGRGAAGRVFLATQSALSDRPLVVKLTPRSGDEHLSLARLQHTHIVPLYLVQDFPTENLRALCMPYLGGTSLGPRARGLASPTSRRTQRAPYLRAARPQETPRRSGRLCAGRALRFLFALLTFRPSPAGSDRAWPMPCTMPINGASCTWTSSHRTYCWPVTVNRCCLIFIWPVEVSLRRRAP